MSTYSLTQLLNSSVTRISKSLFDLLSLSPTNKYYKRIEESSFAGIICLQIPLFFTYFCIADNAFFDAFNIYLIIMIIGGLIFRVIALNWVGNLAKNQNRSIKGWQTLSMILPSISLIILGYTQRLTPTKKAVQKQPSAFTEYETIEFVEVEEQLLKKAI